MRLDDMGQGRQRRTLNAGLWVAVGLVAIPLMLIADVMVFADRQVVPGITLLLLIVLDAAVVTWLWRSARRLP